MRTRKNSPAFTLLELVVVLVILSIVTALAMRSLGGLEDQRRYEANQRDMDQLEIAVLGSPDDRAADGSRASSGFVADMGRLPATALISRTDVSPSTMDELAIAELWSQGTIPAYDIRTSAVDTDVRIASGWHGPYLQPPLGATNLLDGWGNHVRSLTDASPGDLAAGYPRLQDASGAGITTAGKSVGIVRYLGANGAYDDTADNTISVSDRDILINFATRYTASVSTSVTVEALDEENKPAPPDSMNYVVVLRVFGPDPTDASQVRVVSATSGPQSRSVAATLQFNTSTTAGSSTIGPRAIRAYLYQSSSVEIADSTQPIAKSPIKYLDLVSGVNFIPLTISYRP